MATSKYGWLLLLKCIAAALRKSWKLKSCMQLSIDRERPENNRSWLLWRTRRFITFGAGLHFYFASSIEFEFIHMAKKEKKTSAHMMPTKRFGSSATYIRHVNDTLETYANTGWCVFVRKSSRPRSLYMWHRMAFNAAEWWRSTTHTLTCME